jgi:hypothetical protein
MFFIHQKGNELDGLVDLESAPVRGIHDPDVDFDDDMLIPDLAKHMQSNYDELDRQLMNQSDQLNNLQVKLLE